MNVPMISAIRARDDRNNQEMRVRKTSFELVASGNYFLMHDIQSGNVVKPAKIDLSIIG